MDDKERLRLLADAASVVQARQTARTDSVWYFALGLFVLLAAAFRLPAILGIEWLLCGVGLALGGLYGMFGSKLESILLCRTILALAVALFSAYCVYRGIERVGVVFSLLAANLAISSLMKLRRYRAMRSVSSDFLKQARNAFFAATRNNPSETAGLVALQRSIGWKFLLPNDDLQYDYRLLFDRDLVFLLGTNSFFGFRYSPRFRFIAPSRTFHIDVVGESWGGKRSKVRLMLDNSPLDDTLESTPEMLMKAQQLAARHANNTTIGK
jgi:hypothetical protein